MSWKWRENVSSCQMKRVIISVTNDLATDRRVDKVASSLQKLGFEVLLVGRLLPDSLPVERPYSCRRMKLWFSRGPLFYAEFNVRLFFLLLANRANILLSNDLDTLLSNYVASRLKGCALVYDSHEYYTEVPELVNRKRVQRIWQRIEKWIFPRLKNVYTVNESIAALYREKYGVPVEVIRNLPEAQKVKKILSREELGLPDKKFILILQGAGINVDRGAEELVSAMEYLPECFLVIVGSGDVIVQLKLMARQLKVNSRVLFRPKMPYGEMMQYTLNADLGLTLDKDTNLNYRFSLPNKIFDYLKAGIPVLSSDLPELRKVIEQYDIGALVQSHDPKEIAREIEAIRNSPEKIERWSENAKFAAEELTWESQEHLLFSIFKPLV